MPTKKELGTISSFFIINQYAFYCQSVAVNLQKFSPKKNNNLLSLTQSHCLTFT